MHVGVADAQRDGFLVDAGVHILRVRGRSIFVHRAVDLDGKRELGAV
jgi:hypothetical protein